jgi:hypothetical protein
MPTPNLDALDIHDVYQPITDWFAATRYRMMTCKVGEGIGRPRPGGLNYFRQFRAFGVPLRGVYFWIRSDSLIVDQVSRLFEAIGLLGGLQPGEFIQLDWETTPGIPNVSVAQVEEFLRLVDVRYPNRTIVYGSDWVPGFTTWRTRNPDRLVWYANYNLGTSTLGGWAESVAWDATVWQWTSSARVPGIANRVDANHVHNWSALERLARFAGTPTVDAPDVVVLPPPPIPPAPPTVVHPPIVFPTHPQGVDMEVTEIVRCRGAVFAVIDGGAAKNWIAVGTAVNHVALNAAKRGNQGVYEGDPTVDGHAVIREITALEEMHGLGPVVNCNVPSAQHGGRTLIELGWDQYGFAA